MSGLNVLSIDPATHCGWAWSDGIRRQSGTWTLGPKRATDLADHLIAQLEELPTDVLAYELSDFGSPNRRVKAMHSENAGVIKFVAEKFGVRCWGFHPSTWKRLALGRGKLPKGKAGKLEVIRLLRLHHGIEVSDFDEADAIALLIAAQMGPPPLTKKKQARRVAKVLKAKQRTFFKV